MHKLIGVNIGNCSNVNMMKDAKEIHVTSDVRISNNCTNVRTDFIGLCATEIAYILILNL
jgi:hypothetical protein